MNYISSKLKNQEKKTGIWVYSPDIEIPSHLNADKVHYYLHSIIVGRYNRKHDNDGTTRIYSQLMRYLLGEGDESKIRNFLLKNVIYTDGIYSVGRFSKSYGIFPKFEKSIKRFFISNRKLIAKIKLHQSQRKDAKPQSTDINSYLENWCNQFDFEYQTCVNSITNEIHLLPVDEITSKSVKVIQDKYGRRHTPYTRLFTKLRKFINYKGDKLNNNDLCNSQMVNFLKLYKEEEYKKAWENIFIIQK